MLSVYILGGIGLGYMIGRHYHAVVWGVLAGSVASMVLAGIWFYARISREES